MLLPALPEAGPQHRGADSLALPEGGLHRRLSGSPDSPAGQGLSANTVSRLKKQWETEHAEWQKRGLSEQRCVYWWADGVYSNVRMDDRLCLLVIIGVTEQGRKELVAVEDGRRESEASWKELLTGLRERGLTTAPKLAVGDGAMGFWAAAVAVAAIAIALRSNR